MEMCRACLSSEKPLIPLDETFIVNYNLLVNLNIAIFDGLPQFSCGSCLDMVQLFIIFRKKCHTSESTLQQVFDSKIKSEETFTDITSYDDNKSLSDIIKHEIKYEYSIDEPISDSYESFKVNDETDNNFISEIEDTKPKRKRGRPKGKSSKIKKSTSKYMKLNLDTTINNQGKLLPVKQNISKNYTSKCRELSLDDKNNEEIQEEKLLCGLCNKSCEDKIDLIMHLESHKESRCCKQCFERFDSWSQQLSHRLKHIPKIQMCCHICAKRYVTCEYLEFHYRNEHFEDEGKNLTCSLCLSSFSNPRNLKKHIWAKHSEKKFICDYCSKFFHCKSSLRIHIAMHTGNRAYSCNLCDFKSKFYSGLKDHKIRKHVVGKVCCRLCCRAFVNQQEHDKHKCGKHKAICPVCGLQFNTDINLGRHLKTHSDVRKYVCARCPATFKSREALRVHQDRHDGVRRRQCEYCSAKFHAISTLIKHRRIHTGEKPYVCKICSKGFTGNNNLKVHMKVHGEHNLIKKKNKDPENSEIN